MTMTDLSAEVDEEPNHPHLRKVAEFVGGLRAMADLIERRPELLSEYTPYDAMVFCLSAEELAARLKDLGSFEKEASDTSIGGRRRFGPHSLRVISGREYACEKVPTGRMTTVTKTVATDDMVPEGAVNLRQAVKLEYDERVEEYEWKCPDSLLAAGTDA